MSARNRLITPAGLLAVRIALVACYGPESCSFVNRSRYGSAFAALSPTPQGMEGGRKTCLAVIAAGLLAVLVFGCTSLERYRLADESKRLIQSVAVLPLIIGDDQGRISTVGGGEYREFVEYFDSRFFEEFDDTVRL